MATNFPKLQVCVYNIYKQEKEQSEIVDPRQDLCLCGVLCGVCVVLCGVFCVAFVYSCVTVLIRDITRTATL